MKDKESKHDNKSDTKRVTEESFDKNGMLTQRINSDEVSRKAKNKKTKASSETQVVGKIDANKKNKKSKKTKDKKSKKKKLKFKEKHPRIATIFRIILILIILAIIIVAGIIAGAIWGGYDVFELLGSDYQINIEDLIIKYENSTIYDADGNYLGELSAGTKRRVVSMDEMSEYLPKAYVAIEDERFYEHSGVDFKRTAAATVTYIANGGSSSFGGSTITQQVVKNITGDDEDTALRKVKEIVKALQVEHYLSKDQILELYLNLIFIGGDDINGVALGAVYYFNKDVSELSIAECAFMAGINHSPNAYQPFKEYDNEEDKAEMTELINSRTKTVLSKMKELGYITDTQYDEAVAEVEAGLAFSNGNTNTTTQVSYLTEAAIESIIEDMMEKEGWTKDVAEIQLYSGGYTIYTTQKSDIQTTLETELSSSSYALTSSSGQSAMASMTIIEPSTGYVVAAAGRNEDGTTQTYLGYYNLCTDMLKQTGSAIKPLAVTCPGLESGKLTAATMFYDGYTEFGGNYHPKEWYGNYLNKLVSMRYATMYSMNVPHVKALSTIGLQTGVEFLQKMNFTDVTGDEGLAIALGGFTNGASTLQMAAGYAMIANDGVYIEPVFYTQVLDSDGNVYIETASVEDRSTVMMSASNAYIMKSMLQSVVTGSAGTATYATISGMDVAAKTGTTNGDYDRWLCEFTNYYAAACWYGYNDSEYVSKVNRYTAGGICSNVMRSIHSGLESSSFSVPSDIVTVTICSESGMVAGSSCTNTYQEIFVNGTVPETCDIHGASYKICNTTGLLASEFCEDYTVKYIKKLPSSESSGSWTTTYDSTYSSSIPTAVCPHTAEDYVEEYED